MKTMQLIVLLGAPFVAFTFVSCSSGKNKKGGNSVTAVSTVSNQSNDNSMFGIESEQIFYSDAAKGGGISLDFTKNLKALSPSCTSSGVDRCAIIGMNDNLLDPGFKVNFWGIPLVDRNNNSIDMCDCMGRYVYQSFASDQLSNREVNPHCSNPSAQVKLISTTLPTGAISSVNATNITSTIGWTPNASGLCVSHPPAGQVVDRYKSSYVVKGNNGLGIFSILGPIPLELSASSTADYNKVAFFQGWQNFGQAVWKSADNKYVWPIPAPKTSNSPNIDGTNRLASTIGFSYRLDDNLNRPLVRPFGVSDKHLGYATYDGAPDLPSADVAAVEEIKKNFMVVKLKPEIISARADDNSHIYFNGSFTLRRTANVQIKSGCSAFTQARPSFSFKFDIGRKKGSMDPVVGLNFGWGSTNGSGIVAYDPYSGAYVDFTLRDASQSNGARNSCINLKTTDNPTGYVRKGFITTVKGQGSRLSLKTQTPDDRNSILFSAEDWQMEMTFSQFLLALDAARQTFNEKNNCSNSMTDTWGQDYDVPANWTLMVLGAGQEIMNNNYNYQSKASAATWNKENLALELTGNYKNPSGVYVPVPSLNLNKMVYLGASLKNFVVANAKWESIPSAVRTDCMGVTPFKTTVAKNGNTTLTLYGGSAPYSYAIYDLQHNDVTNSGNSGAVNALSPSSFSYHAPNQSKTVIIEFTDKYGSRSQTTITVQ